LRRRRAAASARPGRRRRAGVSPSARWPWIA
jgi:hypothetical protein